MAWIVVDISSGVVIDQSAEIKPETPEEREKREYVEKEYWRRKAPRLQIVPVTEPSL